jgi:hypothetical protein
VGDDAFKVVEVGREEHVGCGHHEHGDDHPLHFLY